MSTSPERCSQLRKLHARLTNELQRLKESAQVAEREGVGAIETLNTIKTLQGSLQKVTAELQQCPPEERAEETVVPDVSEVKPAATAQILRSWFPDSQQDDREDGDELIIDEV